MTDQEFQPPVTPQHPLEKFPGRTNRVTLPELGIEVVIRKVDLEFMTNTYLLQEMAAGDLLSAASKYGVAVNEKMGNANPQMPIAPEALVKMVSEIRNRLLRSAVIAPTLDELRGMVGGRADDMDLGLGSDYSFLAREADLFNGGSGDPYGGLLSGEKGGDARLREATAFPRANGADAAQDGEGLRDTAQ